MKAAIDFSFYDKAYKKGDAVNVTDPIALDVLKKRGHVVEGEGKAAAKPEGESMNEKVETRLAAGKEAEKAFKVPTAKVERADNGKAVKKAAKKK